MMSSVGEALAFDVLQRHVLFDDSLRRRLPRARRRIARSIEAAARRRCGSPAPAPSPAVPRRRGTRGTACGRSWPELRAATRARKTRSCLQARRYGPRQHQQHDIGEPDERRELREIDQVIHARDHGKPDHVNADAVVLDIRRMDRARRRSSSSRTAHATAR